MASKIVIKLRAFDAHALKVRRVPTEHARLAAAATTTVAAALPLPPSPLPHRTDPYLHPPPLVCGAGGSDEGRHHSR